jgi:hypothetical protein
MVSEQEVLSSNPIFALSKKLKISRVGPYLLRSLGPHVRANFRIMKCLNSSFPNSLKILGQVVVYQLGT